MATPTEARADNVNLFSDLKTMRFWEGFGTYVGSVDNEYLKSIPDTSKKAMYWGRYTSGEGESEGTESGTLTITGKDNVSLTESEEGYLDPWGYYSYVNFEQAGNQNFYLYPNWNDATRGGEYSESGSVSGTINISESGNVTITDSSQLNYSETGIDGYYSLAFDAQSPDTTGGVAMFEILFGNQAMSNGTKFRLVFPSANVLSYRSEDGAWKTLRTTNLKVFRYYNNNYYELTPSGGVYTCNGICTGLMFVFTKSAANAGDIAKKHYYRLCSVPYLLVDVSSADIVNLTNQTITNTTNVTSTVTQQTQQQTIALKDTSGSDGIVSSAVNSTQSSLVQKLGFVAQIPTIASEIYQAVTHEGGGTVHFPGVSWEGQTIWPAADVPIVGWMPDSVQNPIRLFNTIVLFLAWMRGVHLIYLRIVRPIDAVIEAVGDEE